VAKVSPKAIIVLDTVGDESGPMMATRDHWYHNLISDMQDDHEPVIVDAEDPLFYVRSSGTSKEPRMFEHRTLGFLVYMKVVFKSLLNFNVKEDRDNQDVCLCLACPTWIYGLQAMLLGPLLNGGTTVMVNYCQILIIVILYMLRQYLYAQFSSERAPNVIRIIIETCKVTHLCTVPEFLLDFIKYLSAMKPG
jgi:acyl-coenzyme A synthetase/AMP-(fatty) acid ligase